MAPADTEVTRPGDMLKELVKPAVGLVANVTVVTALLVYFGWRRAETHADRLGIDESILGMSTREYVLRSVGPVLTLMVGIGIAGLAWLSIEPHLTRLVTSGEQAQAAPVLVRLLGLAWLILPGLVLLMGYVWRALAFVLFPVSIGVGVLLWLYVLQVRRSDGTGDDAEVGDDSQRRFSPYFAGLLVLVCLFWTASNYAEVLGRRLADDFAGDIGGLPGVTLYSEAPLHLEGPGVVEDPLPGEGGVRYRYQGLRLAEHTGGRYFLVSDGWTADYGVVFVIEDDNSLRLDFVRVRR